METKSYDQTKKVTNKKHETKPSLLTLNIIIFYGARIRGRTSVVYEDV